MAIIFDGKSLANELEDQLEQNVQLFKSKKGITPKLVDIIVGDDPASVAYAKMKKKVAERIGMAMDIVEFPENIEAQETINKIKQLNSDPNIHGILIQLPLPRKFSVLSVQYSVINSISPKKDVDCLIAENLGLVLMGEQKILPATVRGITTIIDKLLNYQIANWSGVKGSNVCVVGTSNIVGKPLSVWLRNQGATVTMCGRKTDLAKHVFNADLLISATGVSGLIKKEMIKPGAMVIDVGYPKGDVDFENVKTVASFITPVPGGVGPLTVISLLENTFEMCYNANA
jgi:methylenetetrahydrofolate dehydrogenase (NADP+) / methenyltetrahydrofolate cyclohydrolase